MYPAAEGRSWGVLSDFRAVKFYPQISVIRASFPRLKWTHSQETLSPKVDTFRLNLSPKVDTPTGSKEQVVKKQVVEAATTVDKLNGLKPDLNQPR